MDPFIIGILGALTLLILLAIGMHIGVAMGLVGVFGLMILVGAGPALNTLAAAPFHFAINPEFIVIPLFVLMGLAAMQGGISEATFDALSKLMGRLPGGLGIATVGGCTAFGTVCGSSLVTATVFAKIAGPQMRRQGYEKRFAYGIVSTAGMIGMLIPPSTLAVIYGLLTEESIGRLLIAGIGPGVLLALLYCVGIVIMVKLSPKLAPSTAARFTWRERVVGLKKLWPIGTTAVVVIGGIYGGVFTVGEAGAFGALVILIIAFLWGGMRWKQLANALGEIVSIMAMVFLILTSARILARFLVLSGIGPYLMTIILDMNPTTLQLMLGIVVMYLILGCFLDSISMLSITIPILYPVVMKMGIEPMWFAMVVILSMEAGLITPPVGMNVYGVKAVAEADVTLGDIFIGSLPFLLMTLLGISVVIAFPAVANWLPQQMFPPL